MARPFDFSDNVKKAARFRQFGLCADCSRQMNNLEEHAHHVVPNQAGNPADPSHQWLRTEENCVILCYTCHYAVHQSGSYRTGAVAPPDYYKHSHGAHIVAHTAWAADLNQRSRLLWGL